MSPRGFKLKGSRRERDELLMCSTRSGSLVRYRSFSRREEVRERLGRERSLCIYDVLKVNYQLTGLLEFAYKS